MSSRDNSPLWWAYKAERARARADKADEYARQCERRYAELMAENSLTTSDPSGTITTTNRLAAR